MKTFQSLVPSLPDSYELRVIETGRTDPSSSYSDPGMATFMIMLALLVALFVFWVADPTNRPPRQG